MSTPDPDKTQTPDPTAATAPGGQLNAIELLKQDHREVKQLFKSFQAETDEYAQAELAKTICTALKVHTRIEEELFYPAARDEIDQPKLVEEAIVEHQAAKDLIQQIEQMEPGEELFEARMQVLGEQIDHHVNEEETELFPACQKAGMELDRLGRQMAERKQALMSRSANGGARPH